MAAFIAGSVFPFSSEAIMVAMLAAGMDPWGLITYGTIGNVLGSLFNYSVGRLGKLEWIERYLHVKKEALRRLFFLQSSCVEPGPDGMIGPLTGG